MADHRLSRTQRNEIFVVADRLGLDPASNLDFPDVKGAQGRLVTRITHAATGAHLKIDYVVGMTTASYYLDYWPQTIQLRPCSGWPDIRREVFRWLEAVKIEHDAPDLLQLAREGRAWLTAKPDLTSNSPFTQAERAVLAAQLRALEEHAVQNNQLEDEQSQLLHDQLEYLREASERVGRTDWKGLAISTLITIVLTVGFEPQKGKDFLALATRLLGPLVHGVVQLMP